MPNKKKFRFSVEVLLEDDVTGDLVCKTIEVTDENFDEIVKLCKKYASVRIAVKKQLEKIKGGKKWIKKLEQS
ncbi:MAG: hypothetical protein DRO04_01215 [Candidatus Iainarchaeum archaeon]|mgnify:CR=1 FL=1|uniref:Uncharacterized protein n=1 Tax=Candidatus Iainarchaeum sp. TaxID=3101447 RepID=A0A497JHJ3_9ARCH|nr:MAG: hypothetical protein DRO04_01215 [Candidatus Diapherotrites archaeon]